MAGDSPIRLEHRDTPATAAAWFSQGSSATCATAAQMLNSGQPLH
jgi:hypothetical protein